MDKLIKPCDNRVPLRRRRHTPTDDRALCDPSPRRRRSTAMQKFANREIRVWHGAAEKGP
jgi:hypothetical protein